ncbi:MAG: helix-turn-helix domain-containing protein, partial [Theionarchaea archaeon]|nr:helix-turn-helix domain-containing protein [Theionarchaea archaeon]
MRRAVIEVNPTYVSKFLPKGFFDDLDYIEGKALLRMDFEKGVKIAIFDIKMKEGAALEDLQLLKNISFHKPTFSEYNILSCLTDRQKEIIIAAQKNGYYNVPREITAEELS